MMGFDELEAFATEFSLLPRLVSKPVLFRMFRTVSPHQRPILFPVFVECVGRIALLGLESMNDTLPTPKVDHSLRAPNFDGITSRILLFPASFAVGAWTPINTFEFFTLTSTRIICHDCQHIVTTRAPLELRLVLCVSTFIFCRQS